MNAMETARTHSSGAALAVDANVFQLFAGDHPVLTSGNPGDGGVQGVVGALCIYVHA